MNQLYKEEFKVKDVLIRVWLAYLLLQRFPTKTNVKLASIYVLYYISSTLGNFNFWSIFTLKTGERVYDRVANILLLLKPARQQYSKLLNDSAASQRGDIINSWKKFGDVVTKIPDVGLSEPKLLKLIDSLASKTEDTVLGTHYSGSIYPYTFKTKLHNVADVFSSAGKNMNGNSESAALSLETPKDFESLNKSLSYLYTYSFEKGYLWNSLHESEFGVGYWLSYQVVRMVADMYGGKSEECMGLVTSGGTESLMNAIRLYAAWGYHNKHLDVGQATIIAADNVHAAVNKGCISYSMNLVQIPTDPVTGKIDIELLKRAVKYHKSTLVAIVVSTPSFSLGTVDDVEGVAKIAKEYKVGLHVDSCLGGFIVNFIDEQTHNKKSNQYLNIDGVTSLSCDTHKNGWAPKGSSVLVTRNIFDTVHRPSVNLVFYSAFAIPNWDGGVYGSPANPGSQHITHTLHAYLAMLRIGKTGYKAIAKKIHSAVLICKAIIQQEARVELLGDASCNVFAFRINPALDWGYGATYALAHELSKRKIIVSALKGDRVHYCVTGRTAMDETFCNHFKQVLAESLDVISKLAEKVKQGQCEFPGDAGLYGTLEAATEPTTKNTKNTAEYVSNVILGKRVAQDMVKTHFYILQDPFNEHTL